MKLILKVQDSIAQYKLQDTGLSPPPPLPDLLPPLIDLEKILSDLDPKEKLERYHQDLAADEYLYGPMIDKEMRVIEHDNPVSLPPWTILMMVPKRNEKRKGNIQRKVPKTSTRS